MFVYEQNNFAVWVNEEGTSQDFHLMMDFIRSCNLSHVMLEAPTIFYEIVEEVWSSTSFDTKNKVLSFTIKNLPYSVNNDA